MPILTRIILLRLISVLLRRLSYIQKRAELLTTHPAKSYELVKDDKGQLTLKITNPKEFWSVSKYLVIQVK